MKKIKFVSFFIFLAIFNSCKTDLQSKDYTLKGLVFGTSYKITYLNGTQDYREALDSLFFSINKSLSTYIPSSDVSKINKGDTSIEIDSYFKEVFEKSKMIYEKTDGFFDPTVGNLVNAYGFGPNKGKNDLSDEQISEFMKLVGLDKVRLSGEKIIKEHPKIYLDFNSIAKGYAIDVVARFFNSRNIDNYIIEIGGEIRAKGVKNQNKPWLVKVVNPVDVEGGFKTINLSNKSMATSGNYRKFRIDSSGKKFVHTINPKTGLAQESNLLSASVISNSDCADVDAYATAFMAMGLEKTKNIIEKNKDLKVILIYFDDYGNITEYTNYISK